CVQVQEVSEFNQTLLSPFAPQEPSSSATNPLGGKRSRYSPQVISFSGESGRENWRATLPKNSGPSNHQWPKSSASNGAQRIGGAPCVGNFWIASWVMLLKCSAWSRVRSL